MHRAHHLVECMRPSDGQHSRVGIQDHITLGTKATGDNHLAVLSQRLADGVE